MKLGIVLLCLALPLLELAVMIKVGQAIGVWWTLLALIGIGVAGGMILRSQGFAVLRRAIEATREGQPPIGPMVDSMFLMLAGVLFLIPGFLTDIAGALLLIPPLRRGFARWLIGRMLAAGTFTTRSYERGSAGGEAGDGPRRPQPASREPGKRDPGVVIEGEWERVDEPGKRPRGGPPPTS